MGNLATASLPSEVQDLVFTSEQVSKLRSRFEGLSDSVLLEPGHVQQLIKAKEGQLALVTQLFCREGRTRVCAPELISALVLIAESTLEEKARVLFDFYDFEHSLSISLDELIIMQRLAASALAALVRVEAASPQEVEERVREVLAQVHTQRKGQISYLEFLEFVSRDNEAIDTLWKLRLISDDDLPLSFGGEETHETDPALEAELSRFYRARQDQPLPLYSTAFETAAPHDYVYTPGSDDPPSCHLELEHIYGFRSHDMRNNVRYSASAGKLIFHAGKVAVTMSPASMAQKHFVRHNAPITAIAVTIKGNLCATGEAHPTPVIYVWASDSFDTVKVYSGLLKLGVRCLAFNGEGSRLAAVGADPSHTLAVYDLTAKGMKSDPLADVLASGVLGSDQILSLEFCPNNGEMLAACGVNVFLLIDLENGAIKCNRGISWGKFPGTHLQTLLTIGFVGNAAYTGAISGYLIKWQGKAVAAAQKLHDGAITTLFTRLAAPGLITGGRDGKVFVLDEHLNKKQMFDLADQELGCVYPIPCSICEGQDGAIYIGTRGSEIFEWGHAGAKAVMRGHFGPRLTAICAHPDKKEFVTAGTDCTLAVWDAAGHRQKTSTKLEAPANCVVYTHNNAQLAVGLQNGTVSILDAMSFQLKKKIADRTVAITCLKFSNSGEKLAIAAEDTLIIIYLCEDNYRVLYKLKSHRSPVIAIDFSDGGGFMQSLSSTFNQQFHDLSTGKHDPEGSTKLSDAVWESWSCKLGWAAQGLYSESCTVRDITAVQRSPSSQVLVAGTENGDIRLVKFPAGVKAASALSYSGHAGAIGELGFLPNTIVTVGAADRHIFQWHYEEAPALPSVPPEQLEAAESQMWPQRTGESPALLTSAKAYINEVAAMAPAGFQEPHHLNEQPTYSLSLHRVLGCRQREFSSGLFVTAHGTVLYLAAALVIISSPHERIQQFFRRECSEVTALALDAKGSLAASGHTSIAQQGADIYVWDARTLQVAACIKHRAGKVLWLGFSLDSTTLFVVDDSSDHMLTCYDWNRGLLQRACATSKSRVAGVLAVSADEVLVYGAQVFKYISMEGSHCAAVNGSLGSAATLMEPQLCAGRCRSTIVTGTSQGNLWMWSNRVLSKTVKACDGPVTALYADESNIASAGREGVITLWDLNFNRRQSFDVTEFCIQTGITAIAMHPSRENLIYACTRGCDILQLEDWSKLDFISAGHFGGELWGLCINPSTSHCATAGADRTIRVWDLDTGGMLQAIKPLPHDLRAIDWSLDGRMLIGGLMNGVILLLEASSLNTLHHFQSSFKGKDCCLQDIKFSPDANMAAFGSLNSAKVEVVKVQGGKILKGMLLNIGLSDGITHLDWSADNSYIIVNSRASEVKFVDIIGKAPANASDVTRVKWQTWTCTLGWFAQGLHSDLASVASCDQAPGLPLLAAAYNKGRVMLFRTPVLNKRQASRTFFAHSAQVTKVKFSYDARYLVSTGGADTCVCIWKVQELDRDLRDTESPAEDCRNNVRYLSSGLIVYHAASLGILYDPRSRSQQYFERHLSDVLALAVHPAGRLVASGGLGLNPAVHIWDSQTLVSLHQLNCDLLQKGVGFLTFNANGSLLAAVDLSSHHLLVVFEVNSRSVLCTTRLGGEQIADMCFIDEFELAVVGVRFFKTCAVVAGAAQVRRGEIPPRQGSLQCVVRASRSTVTGSSDGMVTLWTGVSAMKSIQAHQRAVDAMWSCEDRILTGGREGNINILDHNLEVLQTIDINKQQYESVCSSIRSVALSADRSTVLLGTYGSEIYEVKVQSGEGVLHISGHYAPSSRAVNAANEVCGLVIRQDGQTFLTGGDDGTVREWSIAERRQLRAHKLDPALQVPDSAKARALALSPDERSLAIGCKDGTVKVLDPQTFSLKTSKKERKDEISDLKYSPDGTKLAVASYDENIDVWAMPAFKRKSLCKGHTSFVSHLDWSMDSLHLQSCSGAGELFFWDSETGSQLPNGGNTLKNEQWHTLTTVVGWPQKGLYIPGTDSSEVNSVDRSQRRFGNSEYHLLASGDDYGLVKLFRCPSPIRGSQFVMGRGHCSHVTCVRFVPGDEYLVMISPLLALSLCALAACSPLQFHRDFVSRFLPSDQLKSQVLSSASCAKYQCGTASQFSPNQCIYYNQPSNTYNIQVCAANTFCPVALDTMQNSTCIPVMPSTGPVSGLPGDMCNNSTYVCSGAGDQCSSGGVCVGQQATSPCGDQPDCGVGLMCLNLDPGTANDTCQPQVKVGGKCGLPISDDNCINNAVCINNVCVEMFSKGVGAIVSVDYAAFACATGFYKSYPPTGQAVCMPPPTSPNVPQPQTCVPGTACLSSDGEWSVPCECGLNPQGLAFCPPFPGDDIYQEYFTYLVQYSQNPNITSCHFLNLGQEQCGVPLSLWTNLNQAKAKLDFYVRSQNNDECVAAVYNSDMPAN